MKIRIALIGVMAAAMACAHVFDDAVFLFRGDRDANGNGYYNANEMRNAVDINSSLTTSVGINNFNAFTNEVVHCPYSGKVLNSRCLNFAPEITHTYVTNVVDTTTNITVTATGRVSKVYINNVFKSVTGNCSNYTVVVRFRREAVHKVTSEFQDWMLRIGYDWNNGGRGLAIGYNGSVMTNRYLTIMAGRNSFNKNDSKWMSHTETNTWTDLAVAIDGWKMKVWYIQEGDNTLRTATTTFSYDSTKLSQLAALSSWQVQLGSEKDATTPTKIYEMTNGVKTMSDNAYKCFAGSIQQLAFWTRTLTDEDVRQAFGATAPVEFQVGLANGKSSEFTASSTSVNPDNWSELNPSISAGGSISVAYTNDFAIKVPQLLKIIPTSASATGTLLVKMNGAAVKTVLVEPGRTNCVPVDAALFAASSLNTLTLTRTDNGSTPIVVDALSLGGSWVAGWDSPHNDVFKAEHAVNNTVGTYYAGGDWHVLWRGVTTSGTSSQRITLNFPIEKRLVDRGYAFRYVGRVNTAAGRDVDVILNGTTILGTYELTQKVHTIPLPSEYLVDGMNTLVLQAAGTKTGYSCFSYHLVEFEPPADGTMIILR